MIDKQAFLAAKTLASAYGLTWASLRWEEVPRSWEAACACFADTYGEEFLPKSHWPAPRGQCVTGLVRWEVGPHGGMPDDVRVEVCDAYGVQLRALFRRGKPTKVSYRQSLGSIGEGLVALHRCSYTLLDIGYELIPSAQEWRWL